MAGKQIHNLVKISFFSPQGNFEGVKETKLTASVGTSKLVEIAVS